ncbi:uncharacterized protein LOC141912351 [Tubulanus polymorphus]|uniref:uncharacterized protein LOC141912351 n=1 Tax=Tubulanus polymorphus TaxID=672921 RepID=UPI003DA2F6F2
MGQIYLRKTHLIYISLLLMFLVVTFYFVLPAPSGRVKVNKKIYPLSSKLTTLDKHLLTTTTSLLLRQQQQLHPVVNMTHFEMLQEKVKELAALLKEKSARLKSRLLPHSPTTTEFVGAGVYRAKKTIRGALSPKVWNVSEVAVKTLVADGEYFLLLQEAVNKTREVSMRYRPVFDLTAGTCDCVYTYCECCARVFAKRIAVDHKMCANFTYAAGKQDFRVKIDINDIPCFDGTISAQDSPEICLGTTTTEVCAQFLNVTYSVKPSESHKTRLAGCLEYHLNVVNKTIASYPVGCFQTDTKNDKGHFIKFLMNWMV